MGQVKDQLSHTNTHTHTHPTAHAVLENTNIHSSALLKDSCKELLFLQMLMEIFKFPSFS